MTAVLVDSNVLIDIISENPVWSGWSAAELAKAARETRIVIDPIVFGEVSIGYGTIEAADAALSPLALVREPLPYPAAFLAGQAYLIYRRRGGARTSPLPDFFIGAHAAIAGYRLLTRDPRRYRQYFPRLALIAPEDSR